MILLRNILAVAKELRLPANDAFWLGGATLVSVGAGLERLSAGLIVGGCLLLAVAIGGAK